MQLKFSNLADLDLEIIIFEGTMNYGADRSDNYVKMLYANFEMILQFPEIGYKSHPEDFPDLRRVKSGSNMIFYYPHKNHIWVSRIAHERMDFSNMIFIDSDYE